MDIEGTYTLQATLEDVRNRLGDAQVLERTLPGVERLEAVVGKQYALTLNIGHGPLAGRYTGQVTVIDQENPYLFHFTFDGEGRQGKISSDWNVVLDGSEQQTIVAYEARVSVGKLSRNMSAPLVKGAIKLLIQEFFAGLAHQLSSIPTRIVVEEEDGQFDADQTHPALAGSSAGTQPTLAYTIVRRFHLGAGDARAEEQWVRRVRRFGMTSLLLLLVWIGTRLPRKQRL